MKVYSLTVSLHPSILSRSISSTVKVTENQTILEGILMALNKVPEAYDVIIEDHSLKAGFLVLAGKVELKTTKNINKKITKDMEIKIIPISHGG